MYTHRPFQRGSTRQKSERVSGGFTLVELLIVIAVLGILMSISILAYTQTRKSGRDTSRAGDISLLQHGLETFYQKNGEYPAGCPRASCTAWQLTGNTAAPLITTDTTFASLQSIFPNLGQSLSAPSMADATKPLDIVGDAYGYYYYGGAVNTTTSTTTNAYAAIAHFPCAVSSTLAPGQTSSYVIGYYSEASSEWVLHGGQGGVPMTVSGPATSGCTLQ